MFYYNDEITGLIDSIELPEPDFIGGAYYGVGGIGLQYCWQTSCDDILGNPFILDVEAFSIGCSQDTNFINQTVELYVTPAPVPQQQIYLPDTISIVATSSTCFDIVVLADNLDDTLNVYISSPSISAGAVLTNPELVSSNPNMYYYYFWNPSSGSLDSVLLGESTLLPGSIFQNIGGVGLHYCWVTECEDIQEGAYDVTVGSFSVGCFGDTTWLYADATLYVTPPEGVQNIIPNVFTPNGDGNNDRFYLSGESNYCYDSLTVQIYDRWGKLVYESDDPEFWWDGNTKSGQEASEGTYYVILKGIFGDADVTRHYTLTLLRNY
jgi:gliding motility-associated-like protein